MRPEAPEVQSSMGRLRRPGSRPRPARKASRRRVALEGLEPRTLLAILPAASILGRVDVSNSGGDESTPSVAINPSNPQNLASVWVRNDPNRSGNNKVTVEGAVSANGGVTWSGFQATPFTLTDPTATNGQQIAQVSDASVAFDRAGNLYVLELQHTAGNNAGAVVLTRFNASGVPQGAPTTVYSWNQTATNQSKAKAVLQPILAVDDTQGFTDPAGGTQTRGATSATSGTPRPGSPSARAAIAPWAAPARRPAR
jgi:hypothetical protein